MPSTKDWSISPKTSPTIKCFSISRIWATRISCWKNNFKKRMAKIKNLKERLLSTRKDWRNFRRTGIGKLFWILGISKSDRKWNNSNRSTIISNKNYCMLSENMRKNFPESGRKTSFFRTKCWGLKSIKMLLNIWRSNWRMRRVTEKNHQITTGKEENWTGLLKRRKPLSPKWRKRWRTSMKKI